MSEIIAYASSTRPNHLWSTAQFNSALPKNRLNADIPLVAKADADDLQERLQGLELLAWKWMVAHDHLKSGQDYSLPRTTDKPKLVQLVETLTKALSSVKTWAEQRCPCHEETPNPCPLCGASVENLEACKAVDQTFPRDIKRDITAALAAAKEISA